MAQYSNPISSNRTQALSGPQRLSFSGPPFANLFDQQLNTGKLPRLKPDGPRKIKFLPPFLSLILSSTYFLVVLCIILVIPTLELAIGLAYKDQCPVEKYIPIYLIVTGVCGMAGVGLTIVIVRFYFLNKNLLSIQCR